MTRTWEINAEEFGAIERGEGGWSLAVLVACSVEKVPPGNRVTLLDSGKVSANQFAETAGVSLRTVLNYLDAWPEAITAGADVPALDQLGPDDVGRFPLPARPFNGVGGYTTTRQGGGANSATRVAKSPVSLASAIEQADEETLLDALERVTPGRAEPVRAALVERGVIINDPGPFEETTSVGGKLSYLISANLVTQELEKITQMVRNGLFDRLPDDVRQEAETNYTKWIDTVTFLRAIVQGHSISDQALNDLLDAS